jgi:HK97 gp10 family phage protein
MNAPQCKMIFVGDLVEIDRTFTSLDDKVRKRALRSGVTKGCKRVLAAAAARAPFAKGALRVSLAMSVRANKRGVTGKVGPRKGIFAFWARKRAIPLRLLIKGKGKWLRRRPSLYAANVEAGHAGPHPAGPHPFLGPAAEENRAAASQDLVNEVQQAIAEATH